MMSEEKFWARVERSDGCWLWQGGCNRSGHGRMYWRGTVCLAHRIAWEITFGPIPSGLVIRHACDVRQCVNPSHLVLGTQAENNADTRARGRFHPRRKSDFVHPWLRNP